MATVTDKGYPVTEIVWAGLPTKKKKSSIIMYEQLHDMNVLEHSTISKVVKRIHVN